MVGSERDPLKSLELQLVLTAKALLFWELRMELQLTDERISL